ncbi:hypothetical protein [Halomontanus rarus]|uniref:hypothetical protein n=1 Tax=Halomontanus rarus TaxID=3034020 RepID=UPI001A98E9DA|nr:hypothetical protein [Halovivax sp. TS33]
MVNDTFLFGAPLVGVAVGAGVLVFGLFQGGFAGITLLGGIIGALSIALLAFAASQASRAGRH